MKKSCLILLLLTCICNLQSQVKLPQLISNGMVLQRGVKLKLWGWAAPGEKITVSFKGKIFTTSADKNGNWSTAVSKQKAGGPFSMKITGSNEITITDILIGDVWVCSGQSNMEQAMSGRLKYRYADEIATANNKYIRQFLVPDKYSFTAPEKDIEAGEWKSLTPQTIPDFTAVGYFFAKELYEKYRIPIGLVNAALGGSPAQAWVSEGALKKFPEYWNEMQQYKDSSFIAQTENKNRSAATAWSKQLTGADEGLKSGWKNTVLNDADWQRTIIPADWEKSAPGFTGSVIWFRKEIIIPAGMAGRQAKLELGRIADADSVFINGQFAGNTTYQYPPRRYELSNTILKEGKNTIVIRVVSNAGSAVFVKGKKYELTTATDTISLAGTWKYKTGAKANQPASAAIFVRWKPGGLYNAMIAPLTNYAIKGVAWYQGESNADHPEDYSQIMQTLIEDWRDKWQQKNFPFLFVQLPNFMEAKPVPQISSKWAELRQQQLQTLTVPNTGMVVAIDLGEWNDIHPENKKDIGYRLFLLAQKLAYGEKGLIASGPLYQSMKVKGNKIILSFTNTGSGLVANNQSTSENNLVELNHFAIAGADGKYVKATAIIRNNKVEVTSNAVNHPVAVKYAWADNPDAVNFYNKEGLPASPFEASIKK
jgi:sialate O-acetylesterase